ncbi:MAG: hypothetical protein LBT38_11800 [Deltaproteobacteria bacterium]|nr:hypothetical protein [Deltaproteobacteria bacterium]
MGLCLLEILQIMVTPELGSLTVQINGNIKVLILWSQLIPLAVKRGYLKTPGQEPLFKIEGADCQ